MFAPLPQLRNTKFHNKFIFIFSECLNGLPNYPRIKSKSNEFKFLLNLLEFKYKCHLLYGEEKDHRDITCIGLENKII